MDTLRREFMKENKKLRKQENTLSTKNKKRENTLSTKKAIKKKKLSLFLDNFLGRVLVFLFSYFLVFFYTFPPQANAKTRNRCQMTLYFSPHFLGKWNPVSFIVFFIFATHIYKNILQKNKYSDRGVDSVTSLPF